MILLNQKNGQMEYHGILGVQRIGTMRSTVIMYLCIVSCGSLLWSQNLLSESIGLKHCHGLTLRGDTVDMRDVSGGTCIIFFNDYSCRDCFPIVDSAATRLRDAGMIRHVVVLVRVSGGIVERFGAERRARRLMPHADAILFDVVDTEKTRGRPSAYRAICSISSTFPRLRWL